MNIPLDVQHYILSFLNVRDLSSLRLVCKNWKKYVNNREWNEIEEFIVAGNKVSMKISDFVFKKLDCKWIAIRMIEKDHYVKFYDFHTNNLLIYCEYENDEYKMFFKGQCVATIDSKKKFLQSASISNISKIQNNKKILMGCMKTERYYQLKPKMFTYKTGSDTFKTKKPVWNKSSDSWTLEFSHRGICLSKYNFVLLDCKDTEVMEFGFIQNESSFYFRFQSFCLLEAAGIALASFL